MKTNFLMSMTRRGLLMLAILTMISTNVWGANIVIDLDLSNASTYPGDFPNSSTDPVVTSGTYTFGGYSFSFFAPTKVFRFSTQTPYYLALNGVNNTAENNAGYIEFPAIANYKLTEVILTSTASGSTQVGFSIRSNYATTLTGGDQWTNVVNTTHTWTLSGTAANTAYRMYVVKTAGSGSKNGQVKGLKLTYEPAVTSFTVTYNANGKDGGGAAPSDATPYSSGATVTVLGNPNSMTRTGCTFSGWNTAADGSGTSYAAGETFTISANTTLYAKWAATVTWNDNGGVIRTDNIFVPAAGKSVTPPSDPSTDARGNCGNKFMGWTTTADYKGDTPPGVLVNGAQTVTGSADYYAVFADYAE